jgi:hypothetical protein
MYTKADTGTETDTQTRAEQETGNDLKAQQHHTAT